MGLKSLSEVLGCTQPAPLPSAVSPVVTPTIPRPAMSLLRTRPSLGSMDIPTEISKFVVDCVLFIATTRNDSGLSEFRHSRVPVNPHSLLHSSTTGCKHGVSSTACMH
eukprot:1276180-Rhodomonas_salina.1